jgi:hypothetical protein
MGNIFNWRNAGLAGLLAALALMRFVQNIKDPNGCITLIIGLMALAFLIYVVIPVAIIYVIIKLTLKYSRTGKLPWQRADAPAAESEETLAASFARARSEAARAEAARAGTNDAQAAAAARLAERRLESSRKELAESMKGQRRFDRLALVYYVEAALREGAAAAALAAALKSKGWPEAEIEAAFKACGAEFN